MGKPKRPRFGSMGVWPRKRAKNSYARIRSVPKTKEAKLLAFPAYKAGMTHTIIIGTDKNKRSSKLDEFVPATILECPPIKIASIRIYNKKGVAKQLNFKVDKELARKLSLPKEEKIAKLEDIEKINPEEYTDITVQAYTTPKSIGLKKTPELFEIELGGSPKEKLEYAKNHIGKAIAITDVFKEGQVVDTHGITKGKGLQGAVKRFGIGLKGHKSEKIRRTPGSLGGWVGQGHVMYRVAHAGQTGYHQRTQYNNLILKIGDKPEEVNPDGGIIRYGFVKLNYALIKGSIQGPKKRLVILSEPIRQKSKQSHTSDAIKFISKHSHQGR